MKILYLLKILLDPPNVVLLYSSFFFYIGKMYSSPLVSSPNFKNKLRKIESFVVYYGTCLWFQTKWFCSWLQL
jgi:predicted oxidoreductase (fatty acid repression mutant protein)